MSGLLTRIGAFCARQRFIVFGAWIALIVAVVMVVGAVGAKTTNDLTLPGTDSQAATDMLAAQFPPQQNGTSPIVFHAVTGSVNDASNKAAIQSAQQKISTIPHVVKATDPFAQPAAGLVSKDGTYAFIPVLLDVNSGALDQPTAEAVLDATEPATGIGMQAAAGGPIGGALSEPHTESSEIIGLLSAMFILALVFGSLIAMGMPIITAVLGLVVGLSTVGLLGHLFAIPSVGPTLATMIGLGVGIDYALFIVSKHIDQLRHGMGVRESISKAIGSSGSAVVFAGGTVIIALLALAVAGIPLVTALGQATAVAVLTAVFAAITLLPAVLGLVGTKINSARLPGFLGPRTKPVQQAMWGKWARGITGKPWIATIVAIAIMAPLIIPMLSLRLGQEDVGATPTSTTERQAFDMMSAGFGPGYNGPLLTATSMTPIAVHSDTFTSQYNQATAMQTDLLDKQTTLTDEANQLTAQQSALENEQTALLAQQKNLQNQQAALQNQKAQLQNEQAGNNAARQKLRAQAASIVSQIRVLNQARRDTRREIRRLDLAIAVASSPILIVALQADKAAKTAELETNRVDTKAAAKALKALGPPARALAQQERQIAGQAKRLADQAAVLSRQAAQLAAQANDLKQQAADLQEQATDLKNQQAQAQQEQAQALALQDQITAELTKAGGDPRGTDPRIVALQDALTATPGVALVAPPQINSTGDAFIFSAIPTTRPADPATAALVETFRNDVIPPVMVEGMTTDVGGSTAANVDLAALISAKLMLVIAVVLALSFVLLMIAFRSLLIPLQAAITNLLCVGAAFGIMTAVFQWGWGLELIGLDSPYGTVPIASYVPLMMFAALFGLSMDYEVFLVSQIQHAKAAGKSAREAVREGLASSSRVIAAAAIIMISVFGSFVVNPDPTIKQFGVGLSVAVLLAGLMTLLLAPAMIALFGEAAWKLPWWLDRILPHVSVEGPPDSAGPGDLTTRDPHERALEVKVTDEKSPTPQA